MNGPRPLIKAAVVRGLGPERWSLVKRFWHAKVAGPRYRRRRPVEATVGSYRLRVPVGHPAVVNSADQPLRDRAVGLVAKHVVAQYPDASIVDIGANVGDTAAMIGSYVSAPLILVEPSNYFRSLLEANVRTLNVRRIEAVLVGIQAPVGDFHYWGGTAVFQPDWGDVRYASKTLAEVADDDTRFVKIDTDGFDYVIVRGAVDWLETRHPAIYYEVDCGTAELLKDADGTVHALGRAGYRHFAVWDDRGLLVASTDSMDVVCQLHRYLHAVQTTRGIAPTGLDILAVAARDRAIRDRAVADHVAMTPRVTN